MRLLIDLSLDNSAFHSDPNSEEEVTLETLDIEEVRHCLNEVVRKLEYRRRVDTFSDTNGNPVGSFVVDEN